MCLIAFLPNHHFVLLTLPNSCATRCMLNAFEQRALARALFSVCSSQHGSSETGEANKASPGSPPCLPLFGPEEREQERLCSSLRIDPSEFAPAVVMTVILPWQVPTWPSNIWS